VGDFVIIRASNITGKQTDVAQYLKRMGSILPTCDTLNGKEGKTLVMGVELNTKSQPDPDKFETKLLIRKYGPTERERQELFLPKKSKSFEFHETFHLGINHKEYSSATDGKELWEGARIYTYEQASLNAREFAGAEVIIDAMAKFAGRIMEKGAAISKIKTIAEPVAYGKNYEDHFSRKLAYVFQLEILPEADAIAREFGKPSLLIVSTHPNTNKDVNSAAMRLLDNGIGSVGVWLESELKIEYINF